MKTQQRDIEKIRYTLPAARHIADELIKDPQLVARAQAYLGKLQSDKERELVFLIYRDLNCNHIGNGFWHRLQTAAMIRQRHAHFRADILTQVTEEREQAAKDIKKKKTVMQKLAEHQEEILKLVEEGLSSKDIAKYMHRAHRGQFPQHGSPHYKTIQAVIRQFKE